MYNKYSPFSRAARLHGMGGHLQAVMDTLHEVHGENQLGNVAC